MQCVTYTNLYCLRSIDTFTLFNRFPSRSMYMILSKKKISIEQRDFIGYCVGVSSIYSTVLYETIYMRHRKYTREDILLDRRNFYLFIPYIKVNKDVICR